MWSVPDFFDWGMPADTDPAATRSNGYLIIDVQRNNRAPANSSQAEEAYPGRVYAIG